MHALPPNIGVTTVFHLEGCAIRKNAFSSNADEVADTAIDSRLANVKGGQALLHREPKTPNSGTARCKKRGARMAKGKSNVPRSHVKYTG